MIVPSTSRKAAPSRPRTAASGGGSGTGRPIRRRGLAAASLLIAMAAVLTLTCGLYAIAQFQPATASDADPAAPPVSAGTAAPQPAAGRPESAALDKVIVPDVLAVAPTSIGAASVRRVSKLRGVRHVLVLAGGAVQLQGRQVNAFAVPGEFRAWTPPATARKTELWEALTAGRFVASTSAVEPLALVGGHQYPVVAKTMPNLVMGGSGPLGLPGVDMLVNEEIGDEMGLVPGVAVMINAPGADSAGLVKKVTSILGGAHVLDLHDEQYRVPADGDGRPGGYLALYRQAAKKCEGLSWTVLAAIGQIESDHGRNAGPSSAGALGPMQFMPATWKSFGQDGDGDGRADIMNPYDAVPSAARYLCEHGAGKGGESLAKAIWHYNHADWYVDQVLALAKAYAAQGR